MVLDDFEITPGETYVSRYRFVVHRGAPQPEAIDAEWQRLSGDK